MVINEQEVAKARGGDRQAFAMLYDAVAPELYRMALYTLRSPQDAEDVVSETFLEAYKGIGGLRDNGSFRPWIFRILVIRCKRRIKRYIREKGIINLENYLEEGSSDYYSQRAELLEALGRLKLEERQIVLLSALQGYTMREIGDILHLPQGTVSSKLHRTFKKLQKILKDDN